MTDTLDHRTIKQILSRYQTPIPWRSLMQLVTSIIPFVAIWVLMVWSLEVSYALTLVLSVFAAGFAARTFIIFHDCGHGSFFHLKKRMISPGSSPACSPSPPITAGGGITPSTMPPPATSTGAAPEM